MNTEKNLLEAFAGESQANRKYLAFAEKAEKEGYITAAKLFKAAAEAETIHAHNHLKALKAIKSTAENLKEAFEGETYEFENMYPPMLELAEKEGNKEAKRSFYLANEAEKIHAALYKEALENLDKNNKADYYLCPVCGNIEKNSIPEKCFVCGVKREAFIKY